MRTIQSESTDFDSPERIRNQCTHQITVMARKSSFAASQLRSTIALARRSLGEGGCAPTSSKQRMCVVEKELPSWPRARARLHLGGPHLRAMTNFWVN